MGITDTAKWRAVYNDGTFLYELDPSSGKPNSFGDIDFDRIVAFQLVNEKDIAICQVNLGNGKRLIFTRRNQMITGSLFYLLADGRIEMDDEWKTDAVHYRVSTPGLLPEPELIPTKIVDKKEPQEKAYSGSNDSAFKNKK